MTTIGQIAQSYQYILAESRRTGRTPQQYLESLQPDMNQLEAGLQSGQLNQLGGQVLSRIKSATGLGYGSPVMNAPDNWRVDVPDGTARTAIADFRLGLLAVQRPPFNQAGGVEAYMNAVIAAAQNPAVASQAFTLDSLDSARVFSGAPRVDAPAPQPANVQPVNANTNTNPPAPPAPPAAPVPPALTTAVTNFLTGGATAAEITALKGAVNVTDSNPPGQLHGRGGVNGAETLVATRTSLGGPLSATNHPELYTLARARYFAITGLDPNAAPTPEQIDAAETRIRGLPPEQIAEYQAVTYLLGQNETKLSNDKINIDGIYGPRTEASVASANTALRPAVDPADPAAPEPDNTATNQPARPRVVVLDMSIENSRGDRERLLGDVPAELTRQLNTDPARPIRVEVFNPRDNRDGPQTLTQFTQLHSTNADVVGVIALKNDGIRGTDNDLRLTFTGRANNMPAVEMTITDRGMREGMTPAITEAARTMNGMINGTATVGVNEARTFDIVSPQQTRVLEASL